MKTILYIICYIIYPFSFLFKRKKNRYAFGSFRKSFNDNSKYLFIYASQHCKDIDVAWITQSRQTANLVRSLGLQAYTVTSLKGAWHALTSKYWFYNAYTSDIMHCLSGGAVCINLWHGVGIKRIEYNIISGPIAQRYNRKCFKEVFFHPESFRKPDYIVSSTDFQNEFFSTSFRVPKDRCLMVGYPRNMILRMDERQRQVFIKLYEPPATADFINRLRSYSRVLVYMPTWRDSQLTLFAECMDLNRLNEVLAVHNELMIMKPHANVITSIPQTSFSNIFFYDGKMDIYPVLPYTHTLITDYSSILYDYILLPGRDVILYNYDYEEYSAERAFFFPYEENVIGKRVYTFDQLIECINSHDYHLAEEERAKLVEKFWGETTHLNSCQLIMDHCKNLQ